MDVRRPAPQAVAELAAVLAALRCPNCGDRLGQQVDVLRCSNGHSFDIARQGYVNLRVGSSAARTADTAAMIAARDQFLGEQHYAPIARRLSELAARHSEESPGIVLDLAGGTGYYLAQVLDARPDDQGVCLDLSAAALRRAARAHGRALAIGSDVWRDLPIATSSVSMVMCVFGPRNVPEIERVLVRGGVFAVVMPTTAHLRELTGPLGMLSVDEAKEERLDAVLGGFDLVDADVLTYSVPMGHRTVTSLVLMGPSARHLTESELARRVGELPPTIGVTISVRLAVYRPVSSSSGGATPLTG